MKEKRKIKLEEEEQNHVELKTTMFDQMMRKMKVNKRDEWINQLNYSPLIQPSAVAQISGPYISVVGSYRNLLESKPFTISKPFFKIAFFSSLVLSLIHILVF